MLRSTNKPKRWRSGQKILASRLDAFTKFVNDNVRNASPARQVVADPKFSRARVGQFRILQIQGDYLLCEEFDGTDPNVGGIYIAKPPLLRASLESHGSVAFSAYNSQGTARTATQGEESESQVVVPAYTPLDTIFAIRNINRSTGVIVDGNAQITDSFGVGISGLTRQVGWLDLNVDARAWAKAAE